MGLIIVLAAVGYLAYRVTTPEQRRDLVRSAIASVRNARAAAAKPRPEMDRFHEELRARTPFVIVAPALVALNVIVFAGMIFGSGSLSDPATLVGWGASVGPRTTNGEWWRLVTALFVHGGLVQLAINTGALYQTGMLLERLIGRPLLVAVYVAAGLFAGLISLSAGPIDVTYGASASVAALYGLLAGALFWAVWRQRAPQEDGDAESPADDQIGVLTVDGIGGDERTPVTIPLRAVTRLAPVAALFVLFNLVNGSIGVGGELAGAIIGLAAGLALSRNVTEGLPALRPVGMGAGIALVLAAAFAVPLRGIADVKPEIARVVAVEDSTSGLFRKAADGYKAGRMNAESLAQLIDRSIVPDLQAADARLKALRHVPPEHQGLVTDAEEYLRLRTESWNLRAAGLRKSTAPPARTKLDTGSDTNWRLRAEAQHRSNLTVFGKAEGAERASLEAFAKIKNANGT